MAALWVEYKIYMKFSNKSRDLKEISLFELFETSGGSRSLPFAIRISQWESL